MWLLDHWTEKAYQRIIQKNIDAPKQSEETVILVILRKDLEKVA